MTEYYVYTADGKREVVDKQPNGYYYTQEDGVGSEVTLWYRDPFTGEPKKVESFESGTNDYLITQDGEAFGKESDYQDVDGTNTQFFKPDKDDPQKGENLVDLGDTYGEDYEYKDPSELTDPEVDEETGEFVYPEYGKFPLHIETPVGDGRSRELVWAIQVANYQLKWLSRQMGTGDINKPEYLLDPEGDKKQLDDNLDEAVVTDLAAMGNAADSEQETSNMLLGMKDEWEKIDQEFGTTVLVIDDHNHAAYTDVYGYVTDINAAMALSLVGKYEFKSGDRNSVEGEGKDGLTEKESEYESENEDVDLNKIGIQNVVEEAELYEILARGIGQATARVDKYAQDMIDYVQEHPEHKHWVDDGDWHAGNDPESEKPGEENPGDEEEPGNENPGNENPGNENPGNENPGNQNPGNQNPGNTDPGFDSAADPEADPEADPAADPAADPDAELADVGEEFSNILGGSTSTPEGSATEDLLGGGEEDKSSSLEDRVMEYINGDTGNAGGGATQAQAPAQPQQSGMDPSAMMAMPLLANAMGGQGPFGGGEKGEDKGKDDEQRGRDQDRQVPGPPQQSPGVPVTADPGAATAQPAVAAPTDTGAPPIVSTPGATVDWPMPGDPETKIKVPQGVSDALTRQQGNPAIDAGTAYAGTPGEQTVEHPWQVVDVSALRTGDVIAWENHSAVVVDNGNGPHYLENGQLVPLNQSNLDNPQYGKFQNYFHPTGLDAAGGTNMQIPEAPTEMPEPKITASQPPEPPPIQGPEQT